MDEHSSTPAVGVVKMLPSFEIKRALGFSWPESSSFGWLDMTSSTLWKKAHGFLVFIFQKPRVSMNAALKESLKLCL